MFIDAVRLSYIVSGVQYGKPFRFETLFPKECSPRDARGLFTRLVRQSCASCREKPSLKTKLWVKEAKRAPSHGSTRCTRAPLTQHMTFPIDTIEIVNYLLLVSSRGILFGATALLLSYSMYSLPTSRSRFPLTFSPCPIQKTRIGRITNTTKYALHIHAYSHRSC
jgi:hypothetical protein